MARINKYLTAYMTRLKTIAEYKIRLFSQFTKPLLKITVLAFLWINIFNITGKQTIAGLDVFMFIHYITLAGFIKIATLPWLTSDEVVETIKSGNLTSIITKPIDYLKLQFSFVFAEVSMNGLYGIGIFLIGSLFGSLLLHNIYFPDVINLSFFLVSVLLAIMISYFFYFIVACTAFWFGETWSVLGGIIMIQSFLSGEIIPLNISPMLLSISNLMPFKSMSFVPIFIYLGRFGIHESLINIAGQIVWLVVLMLLARYILNKGIEHFESQGG